MSDLRPTAVIVLAAGEGTRMKSTTPKVLHTIGGRSLVAHAIRAARGTSPHHLAVVVRHERDRVAEHVGQVDPEAVVADQDDVKGTGRAVECALEALPGDLAGTVVVTYGDVPLLTSATLEGLVAAHHASGSAVTVITATLEDPTGYGRVIRDAEGSVVAIVEQKDADEEQRAIREVNSGLYAFDAAVLREALSEVGTDNAQGEKYLTDVIAIARGRGLGVRAHLVADLWQTEGVNDKVQLARLGAELNRRTVEQAMRDGAIVIDPATTWLDADVTIGPDTVVRPGTQILGASTIGRDCVIGPDTTLTDVEVGDGASVVRTQAELAEIGPGATVGPFSYLRPGTRLGAKGKIGGFVETKNADIGAGAKVPHLTYCGDATIGEGANIGAGTIFANYDGVTKGHTNVGAHSFVGSNSVIVAPRTIADGAYVAAGSAVVSDVAPGQLAVTRAQQRNVDGWVARRRAGTKTDEAARAAQGQATPAQTPERTSEPTSEPTSEQTPAQTSETKDAQR
ncbi:bifunctional N-acetylglucosamine-1-phosphate uridyltransferase/glucosamine-1-phosphate acetyltransferase [Terrabacter sp. Root85]|uniref:bifunctional UDP-N-acetylglucosamine diphosphorylase/glucosamine-1-phosphate N-acetyltransferase GlmU n=1 Tax=Terrabacter sp. Root85 TaxID=1736603 RepID=UPI0006F6D072|nr:bifunctional UDP-N-acetylglucosamine diphosphorylase/glucosamine-1-phosphate N-acetyltransferase GlmU [Terrabacter sp. Root85]KRC87308.1 bifunctional N-acetylglucosamine-1-phosphate uridyltransferase/glucosamine-1-phosphate acetyltransferase [Terrabacter sp. Root85]